MSTAPTPKPLCFLALETSTDLMSVALSVSDPTDPADAARVWSCSEPGAVRASNRLIPAIHELLAQARLRLTDLSAIVFGQGPGAFTGLRTACAVAQGLGFGAGVPLLPVSSLLAVAEAARTSLPDTRVTRIMAALDARMGEIYAVEMLWQEGSWHPLGRERLLAPEQLWPACCAFQGQAIAGNVFEAYAQRMNLPPTVCLSTGPTAEALLRLAPARLQAGLALPAHQAAPSYVRNKVALTSVERATA
jgi:tRNA threonylcarbamoyladenosine biosynthesis protein TsaB